MNVLSSILLTLAAIILGMLVSYFIIRRFSRAYEAYYMDGIRLKEQGRLDEALSKLKGSVWQNNGRNFLTPSAYLSMAEIYFKKEDLEKSLYYIDLAIKNYKKHKYPTLFIEQAEKLKARYQRQLADEPVYN